MPARGGEGNGRAEGEDVTRLACLSPFDDLGSNVRGRSDHRSELGTQERDFSSLPYWVNPAPSSTLTNLAIAGVGSLAGDQPVAPNTNISLPGVGYVVLNEQIPSGDGVSSSGLTVNMIHVYLQSVIGGVCTPLGCLPGTVTKTGEIIVGSASSTVAM